MNKSSKTSEQVSREWAESLVDFLQMLSHDYRMWDELIDMPADEKRLWPTYLSNYSREELLAERDKAFLRFLNYRTSFSWKQ